MKKQVAIYARVSSGEQTPDNQLKVLRAVARRMKWKVVEEFVDHGVSGAKDRDQRTIECTKLSFAGTLI